MQLPGLHNAAPAAVQMITGESTIAPEQSTPVDPYPPSSRKAVIGACQTRRCRRKGPISVAQRVVVSLSDDIDGGEAAETVSFALDGKSYEIDLNPANAKKLRKTLAPYMAAGRKQTNTGKHGRAPVSYHHTSLAPDPAAVRAWARSHRMEVRPGAGSPRRSTRRSRPPVERRPGAMPGMIHSASASGTRRNDTPGSRLAQHPRRSARVWSTPKGKAERPGPKQRAGVVQ